MSEQRRAHLSLRYRPGADVLSGHVVLDGQPVEGVVAESPDADSTVVWSTVADGVGAATEILSSFQVVHASARWPRPAIHLPDSVLPVTEQLIASGRRTLDAQTSAAARLMAKVEVPVDVPLGDLARPVLAPATPSRTSGSSAAMRAGRTEAKLVAAALRKVAATIGPCGSGAHGADPDSARLDSLVRELATTLGSSAGRTAPGTTAAARVAVTAAATLGPRTREALLGALADLDDPATWARARRTLLALARTRPPDQPADQPADPPADPPAVPPAVPTERRP